MLIAFMKHFIHYLDKISQKFNVLKYRTKVVKKKNI